VKLAPEGYSDDCAFTVCAPARVLEISAFCVPLATITFGFPTAAGAVGQDAAGRNSSLHFAPGRWLVPNPNTKTLENIDAAVVAGLVGSIDVEGKWREVVLSGSGTEGVLGRGVDLTTVCQGRACAATTFFDSPVVVARQRSGFEVWVQASYLRDVLAHLERCR
jgi:heterotetrameric sarcosine oxidase gamma subunit